MMWERVVERIGGDGCDVRMRADVERVLWDGDRVTAVDARTPDGTQRFDGSHFVCTMPIRELIAKLDPPPPKEVREAAGRLSYRDFLTVALIVDQEDLFPDNWIYVHDPGVKVGRVQNFHGARHGHVVHRARVLLLRGRRPVDHAR
jgi:protoporphyrinogen oxidase